ncbi:MAG: TerB family tellurite resistance protein [Burkholderiaceae bacterium]
MLKAIRDFFDRNVAAPDAGGHGIELATAALLVEVVRIDRDTTPAEREAVLRAVHEKFGLSGAEADALIALAEDEVRRATDYYQFTSLINRRFTQAQKERVIELMWRVAYADAKLSAHELHLMRKIAGLLHVPDDAYIAAKLRAKEHARG